MYTYTFILGKGAKAYGPWRALYESPHLIHVQRGTNARDLWRAPYVKTSHIHTKWLSPFKKLHTKMCPHRRAPRGGRQPGPDERLPARDPGGLHGHRQLPLHGRWAFPCVCICVLEGSGRVPSDCVCTHIPFITHPPNSFTKQRTQTAPPLPCPLAIFAGQNDDRAPLKRMEGWTRFVTTDASRQFSLDVFPGGHFFVKVSALCGVGCV